MTQWVAWGGGECPVEQTAMVRLRMRSLLYPQDERGAEMRKAYWAGDIARWTHEGNAGDILAYAVQ
jgi:hypothetical protein